MEMSNHKKRAWDDSTMNTTFEGSDFLLDLEMTYPSGKLHIVEDLFRENNCRDADVVAFLANAQAFWNAKSIDDNGDDDDDDDADLVSKHFVEENLPDEAIQVKRETARMGVDDHSRKEWKEDGNNGKTMRKKSGEENDSRIKGRRRTPVSCMDKNRRLDSDGDEGSGPKYSGLGKKMDESLPVIIID